jgi:hypothetical protein
MIRATTSFSKRLERILIVSEGAPVEEGALKHRGRSPWERLPCALLRSAARASDPMACHGLQKRATVCSGAFSPAGEPHHTWVLGLPDRGRILGRILLSCPELVGKQFPGQSSTSVISLSFRGSCRTLRGLILQKWKVANPFLWKSEFSAFGARRGPFGN